MSHPVNNAQLTMLQSHFGRIARRLQSEADAAKSFDHSLNKGQIREAFIREFLENNTSTLCGIGTGEIIHSSTASGDPRNQIDVVVYNKTYPKLSLATGIDIFFAETVSSFIEIKSSLKKNHLREIAAVTKKIKTSTILKPQRFNPTGMVKTPRPYSFVFAYDGPKKITTVLQWMKEVAADDAYNLDALRATEPKQRVFFNNQFIDGVFVLGLGYVLVDALPFQSPLIELNALGEAIPLDHIWWCSKKHELGMLWALINQLSWQMQWTVFDLTDYTGSSEIGVAN